MKRATRRPSRNDARLIASSANGPSCSGLPLDAGMAWIWAMPALTRRRYPERPNCWPVYYDDVQVGCIAGRPASRSTSTNGAGIAASLRRRIVGTGLTERPGHSTKPGPISNTHGAPTSRGAPMLISRNTAASAPGRLGNMRCAMPPAANATGGGRSTCFCGAAIDNAGLTEHVYAAHIKPAAEVFSAWGKHRGRC
jgi:hypothetical protein